MYRVIGKNVYHKFISEEDKDGIIDATADWRMDGSGQKLWLFDEALKRWLKWNNTVLEKMETQTEPVWMDNDCPITEGIYLKTNDKFIGFSRNRFEIGKILANEAVFIVPEYRGNAYLTESSILGIKTVFDTLEGNEIHSQVPVDKSSSSLPTTTKESNDKMTKFDRVEPITYKKTVYTRAEYLSWINDSKNEHIKNAPYEYILRYTE